MSIYGIAGPGFTALENRNKREFLLIPDKTIGLLGIYSFGVKNFN
jgi:hypothetical protein